MHAEKSITVTCQCASFTLPQVPGDNWHQWKSLAASNCQQGCKGTKQAFLSWHGHVSFVGVLKVGLEGWFPLQANSCWEEPLLSELFPGTNHPFFPALQNCLKQLAVKGSSKSWKCYLGKKLSWGLWLHMCKCVNFPVGSSACTCTEAWMESQDVFLR